jgi:hypothetical protein
MPQKFAAATSAVKRRRGWLRQSLTVPRPHEPSNHAERGQPQYALLYQPASAGRTSFTLRQGPVGIQSGVFRFGPRPGSPIRHRDPARDQRERFGGTSRALLIFVNLFTIQTQARASELHVLITNH